MPPQAPSNRLPRLVLLLPLLLLLLSEPLLFKMSAEAAEAGASRPVCEHETGRLILQRRDGGTQEEEAEVTHRLSEQLHLALMEWSAAPGGCRGEVVFEGAAHCGKAYELPGAYSFHGHGAHLTLTAGNCTGTGTGTGTSTGTGSSSGGGGGQTRVVSLHSEHGVHLFRFTGGASIHARGIGFQGGTGKWGGAVELSGEGRDSDSDFDGHDVVCIGCVFDHDLALSSGGAVVVEGAIDPDTAEPTTARFHDCVFTHNSALQGGALFIAPTKPGRARVELEGCTFEANEAYTEGGAVYVAGDLVFKGKKNRFTDNHAGHRDADVHVDEALGGRVLHEESREEL